MPSKKSNTSPAENDPYKAIVRLILGDNSVGNTDQPATKPERDSSGHPAGVNLDTFWADKPSTLSP